MVNRTPGCCPAQKRGIQESGHTDLRSGNSGARLPVDGQCGTQMRSEVAIMGQKMPRWERVAIRQQLRLNVASCWHIARKPFADLSHILLLIATIPLLIATSLHCCHALKHSPQSTSWDLPSRRVTFWYWAFHYSFECTQLTVCCWNLPGLYRQELLDFQVRGKRVSWRQAHPFSCPCQAIYRR